MLLTVFFVPGLWLYIVSLFSLCNGCCAFCLICDAGAREVNGACSCHVCNSCPVAVLNCAFCMVCSLFMLVEDAS